MIHLRDVYHDRAIDTSGVDWHRIVLIGFRCEFKKILPNGIMEIPREDFKQIEVRLKEPFNKDDLAASLEKLANMVRIEF